MLVHELLQHDLGGPQDERQRHTRDIVARVIAESHEANKDHATPWDSLFDNFRHGQDQEVVITATIPTLAPEEAMSNKEILELP